MKKTLGSLAALLLALVCTTIALAQTTNTITGRVTDPQGAAVKGTSVKLYARDNRVPITTTSEGTGAYRFEGLAPGEYIVEVESPGFASRRRRGRAQRGHGARLYVA